MDYSHTCDRYRWDMCMWSIWTPTATPNAHAETRKHGHPTAQTRPRSLTERATRDRGTHTQSHQHCDTNMRRSHWNTVRPLLYTSTGCYGTVVCRVLCTKPGGSRALSAIGLGGRAPAAACGCAQLRAALGCAALGTRPELAESRRDRRRRQSPRACPRGGVLGRDIAGRGVFAHHVMPRHRCLLVGGKLAGLKTRQPSQLLPPKSAVPLRGAQHRDAPARAVVCHSGWDPQPSILGRNVRGEGLA